MYRMYLRLFKTIEPTLFSLLTMPLAIFQASFYEVAMNGLSCEMESEINRVVKDRPIYS